MTYPNVVLLAGGVGGAKLAEGLALALPAERLAIIGNTGDDFQHLGLTICPDLDTVLYTLAGVASLDTGWGRAGESWRALAELGRLGGPQWFRLGDLDLATHLLRSHLLAEGQSLTDVTLHLGRHFGVKVCLLPMSNRPAPTLVETDEELLSFQSWFVARRWQPAVRRIHLPDDVRATPEVITALEQAEVVIIAPSNPFVSVDPILNVYPIRALIQDVPELVMAVSPIVGGRAVKGPAAKMMAEMGLEVSPAAVAEYYGDLIDVFIYDQRDAEWPPPAGLSTRRTDTLMPGPADRRRLAAELLQLATELIHP